MAKFNWKITARKFLKSAFYVLVAGLAAVYGQNNWYMLLAPLLVAVENYVKNR